MTSILDDRAREILRLRFHEDLLQSEIAEQVGCSQMHVSRIIRSSLERLYSFTAEDSPSASTSRPRPKKSQTSTMLPAGSST